MIKFVDCAKCEYAVWSFGAVNDVNIKFVEDCMLNKEPEDCEEYDENEEY